MQSRASSRMSMLATHAWYKSNRKDHTGTQIHSERQREYCSVANNCLARQQERDERPWLCHSSVQIVTPIHCTTPRIYTKVTHSSFSHNKPCMVTTHTTNNAVHIAISRISPDIYLWVARSSGSRNVDVAVVMWRGHGRSRRRRNGDAPRYVALLLRSRCGRLYVWPRGGLMATVLA